jgi:hypothetical protein
MNKIIQYAFLILLPFYPLWAWLTFTMTKKNISIFTIVLFIPVLIFYLASKKIKVPNYLILFILFTIYHFTSIIVNNIIPPLINPVFYVLSDVNLLAIVVLLVVENTDFEDWFILAMNRLIFILVLISLVVSIIQIKSVTFFVSPEITTNPATITYLEQHRNFSIFSWININSLGITFPIVVAILLSFSSSDKSRSPVVILSSMIVSFLTRARYVMISTIVAISQLFFVKKIETRKKIYLLVLIMVFVGLLLFLANTYDFNIQQIISNRILERRTGGKSAGARIASLNVFLEVFPQHPWFGVGPQTRFDVLRMLKGITTSIHVGYLSYLYYYGIAGASLLFVTLYLMLKRAWMAGKNQDFWGGFFGLVTFCFANTTFTYFNLNEAGVILVMIYLKYYTDKSKLKKKKSTGNC